MRKSSFTIGISMGDGKAIVMNHPFNLLDIVQESIAVHINNGTFDQLDDRIVAYLIERGYLTTDSAEVESERLTQIIDRVDSTISFSPTYCFVTTYRCNLACSYCFQSNEDNRRTVSNRSLTMADAKSGVAVMATHPVDPDNNDVHLFGGEPLLPNLRPVIEYIVNSVSALGYTTSATTNGTMLHQFEDLLGPDKLSSLLISLDGPPDVHNARRAPLSGRPTFDQIWKNVLLALSHGCNVTLRCNIDRRNVHQFADLVEIADASGVLDDPSFNLRYARVRPDFESKDQDLDVDISWAEIEDILLAQAQTRPVLSKLAGPSAFEDFRTWVEEKFPIKYTRHCGAVSTNTYFGPSQEVFNCHQVVGQTTLSIGRYVDGEVKYNDNASKWTDRRPDRLSKCSKCPYALICAGGCAANVDLDNEPLQSNCDNFHQDFTAILQRQWFAHDGDSFIGAHGPSSCGR